MMIRCSNVPVEVRLLRVQPVSDVAPSSGCSTCRLASQVSRSWCGAFKARELRAAISIRAPQFRAGDGGGCRP